MNFPRFFANALLLLTVPSMAAYPQTEIPSQSPTLESNPIHKLTQTNLTYDDILTLLNQLENGELEKSCSDEDLDQINQFFANLATEGMIPGDPNEEFLLACDIHNLLSFEYAYSYGDQIFSIIPCKSWIHKRWDVTKKFVKKHKKAIVIGAVAVVAVTVIVLTAGAATAIAPAAAGAIGAATAESEESFSSVPTPSDASESSAAQNTPELRSAVNETISSLKNRAAEEHHFLNSSDPVHLLDFTIEENSRILGSVYAHRQVEERAKLIDSQGGINAAEAAHQEIDQKFSTDFTRYYTLASESASQIGTQNTLSADLYHLRGQRALDFACYDQAISDLGRTLELNPHNPEAYLGRAKVYLGKGDYEHCVADYQKYTVQKPTATAYVIDFSIGLAKGLPRGAYDSGEQFATFAYSAVSHPIDTGTEVCEAFALMSKLVYTKEWETIGKALSPEVHQLITEWDTLSPMEQGERAGYAIGKHGVDIFLPCAAAKAVSKCAAGTRTILTASQILNRTEQTLALEMIARSGTSADEIAQTLAKLGKGERVVARSGGITNSGLEKLVSPAESQVLKTAISQNRHTKMVRDYLEKPAKEIQKGINSYEKQIAIHRDKIASPTKYYPDWDKLDLRQREALVNKKWPAEIKGYEEQRSVLQSVLHERIFYE